MGSDWVYFNRKTIALKSFLPDKRLQQNLT